jgi:hypothetical protein
MHFYRMGNHSGGWDELPPVDSDELDALINSARKHIEPWLSAVFQAEHLNLLLGSGFTAAVGYIAGAPSTGMAKVKFGTTYDVAIDTHAPAGATAMKRGAANIEDQFRSALALRRCSCAFRGRCIIGQPGLVREVSWTFLFSNPR